MRQGRTTEIHVYTIGSGFKRFEIEHELEAFECDEQSQYDTEEIEPPWAVRVSPTLNIRDDTHSLWIWYLQSLVKKSGIFNESLSGVIAVLPAFLTTGECAVDKPAVDKDAWLKEVSTRRREIIKFCRGLCQLFRVLSGSTVG